MAADRLIRCSHDADQSRYYQIGPYFFDYPFDVFKFNHPLAYEDSYEYRLASIIFNKLDYAFYPDDPVFKSANNGISTDSILVLFPENLMQNSVLKFAVHLYQEQAFFQAATEFKRYLNEETAYKEKVLLLIGCSHYFSKRYPDAIYYFEQSRQNSNDTEFSHFCEFLKAISFFNNRNAAQAEIMLTKLLNRNINPVLKDNIFISLVSLYLKTNNTKKIKQLISKKDLEFSNSKIQDSLAKLSKNRKSPALAMILSIIPGLGHLYSGSFKEGLYSFLTNSALGYLFYDSYQNGSNSGKIISVGLFLQFYSGNLVGGKRAATVRNSIEMEKINSKIQAELKLAPEFKIIVKNEMVFLKTR